MGYETVNMLQEFKNLLLELGKLQTPREKGLRLVSEFVKNLWLVDFFRVGFETPYFIRHIAGVTPKLVNKAIDRAVQAGMADEPRIAQKECPDLLYEVSAASPQFSQITQLPIPHTFGKLVINGVIVGDLILSNQFLTESLEAFRVAGIRVLVQQL